MREHERAGAIPTDVTFVFYELEQRGIVPKKYEGINPRTGKEYKRTPRQDVSDALMYLREQRVIPWDWILDTVRVLHEWRYAATVLDYVRDTVPSARIDVWGGGEPPLIICESRATAGILDNLAYEYVVPITATGGQSGGHIVNSIVPLLQRNRPVRYIGDYELRGPAEQIEANTRRYIEKHTRREFRKDEWVKIALTQEQVNRSARLQRLALVKLDKRYKPPKQYDAIECEALGQGVLVRMVRTHLDRMRRKRGLEPIEQVREREEKQRERVAKALRKIS
jgi:hypothetical protein